MGYNAMKLISVTIASMVAVTSAYTSHVNAVNNCKAANYQLPPHNRYYLCNIQVKRCETNYAGCTKTGGMYGDISAASAKCRNVANSCIKKRVSSGGAIWTRINNARFLNIFRLKLIRYS